MGYKIARLLIKLLFFLFTRLEVDGEENLPPSGSLIIAANHLGRLDVPLVYYFLDRPDVILLIAEKYQKVGVARWFVDRLDGIWVDRFNADFSAMRKALARLRAGGVLVLSPEGTRSPTEKLLEAKPGAGYLAAKAGVPVLPVAVTGTEDRVVLHQLSHFRRPTIKIRAGEPFQLPPYNPKVKNRDEVLKQYTDEIMCRIAALLPPRYRGFYAEHLRVNEILAENKEPAEQDA
ncbi:MAG TPA: lysophospholipid acyltransferase family protein [Anaerolineales bacterium]|nr:lysophospholipid acyltransferase family protein [Anaerolineales bacterium]